MSSANAAAVPRVNAEPGILADLLDLTKARLNLLVLISLVAFVLLIVNIWRRGWILPLLAVGTWGVIAVLVGGIVPAFIQRFTVEPSESSRERPYIERNIEATRQAMNLGGVTTRPVHGVSPSRYVLAWRREDGHRPLVRAYAQACRRATGAA